MTPVVAAVVLAFLSAPAFAQSTQSQTLTVAVLGMEALDVPDTIAAEVTEALRQRVTATPGFRLVAGKDLVEIKLVFACPDESSACMAQAGTTLGAAKVLFGNVRKVGGDYMVTLKSLDVGRSVIEGATSDTVPIKRAEPTAFAARTPRWIARLTGRETTGAVSVRANVTGAAITLDGVAVGLTDSLPVTIPDVAPGRHQLVAEKQGYGPARQEFTLAAGQSLPLGITLAPLVAGGAAPEPVIVRRPTDDAASGGQMNLARVGFWTALVGAATSAALALKFGHDVTNINKDLDALRRYDCASGSGLCDKDGKAADQLTPAQKAQVASKVDDGNRAQTLQWVFVGLIPPFAIAGGYLLYKGYLDTENNGSSTAASKGLRIFPTASASAGGVMAEFDF